MLRVYNLPPEPGLCDWLRVNRRLMVALVVWSIVMMWGASVGVHLRDTGWYAVRIVENGLIYDRAIDERSCLARVAAGDATACAQGQDLMGKPAGD